MFQQSIFQGPGTGTFTTHTFEIIFMLLVTFLIGLWFGWVLWSRYRQAAEKLRLENESLNATATALRSETDTLKTKLRDAEAERATLEGQVQSLGWDQENLRNQLTVLESDLEKVQDRNRHLETELGLAMHAGSEESEIPLEISAPLPSEPMPEELPDLEETIANAEEEAANAANPDIQDMEEALAAVVAATTIAPQTIMPEPEDEEAATPPPPAEPESPPVEKAPVIVAVSSGPRDDLKIVEGIGPKIEEVLFKAGINTFGQLAATSVQQLKDLLNEAGPRFAMHDPGTWSAQALLASNGEWENLKAYQDFLNAGKRPDKT